MNLASCFDIFCLLHQLNSRTEVGANAVPVCSVSRQRMILMGKELKNEKQVVQAIYTLSINYDRLNYLLART